MGHSKEGRMPQCHCASEDRMLKSGRDRRRHAERVLMLTVLFLMFAFPRWAGGDSIYGIRADGTMVFYRFAGMEDGANRWSVEQKEIGIGWNSFPRVFSGGSGALYAITADGQMLYYRYAGMEDGANRWAVERKVIGSGWNGLREVFAGPGGTIYAITPDGQMLFYRFA